MNIGLMSFKKFRHICTFSYRCAPGFVLHCSTSITTRAVFVFTTNLPQMACAHYVSKAAGIHATKTILSSYNHMINEVAQQAK